MKYYIIAGEASGDLHGSNLIHAIHDQDKQAVIRCWGGDKMQAAGATLVKHYKDLAFMGFVEVLKHLGTIIKNLKFCKQDINHFKPDVLVLIDYPGFNLRIAEWAKRRGIKVLYYISPQIWAWKENRVHKIKKSVDKMVVILPFEKDVYAAHNFEVEYVGHPLIEVIKNELSQPIKFLSSKPIIAILPGSRKQEIQKKLPIMLQMEKHFLEYQFIIAQAPSLSSDFYLDFLKNSKALLVRDDTYNIVRQAQVALVTSGTATLETALLKTPQIVCYKSNAISYRIAKRLIKVKYISLVNLILDKLVVCELIQGELNEMKLKKEVELLLHNTSAQTLMQQAYQELWDMLDLADTSTKVASLVINLAQKN